ncbi:MAG: NAD(P)-dependent alcohol dehydrogenase [Gammaproteobacteria bacterium]|nr:NAD(P)-dependent alcohol dehydrogenase [Gammaproteobacteria bacterium]
MQAIVCTAYGGPQVLQIKEVDKPVPEANQILVRVKAASVTTADTFMRKGSPLIGRLFMGLIRPKYAITGTGFAGVVEAVGAEVRKFQIGDQVFGESIFGQGSHAEYLCIDEGGVVAKKPANISFSEAAPVCDGALTSLNFLQGVGNLQAGQRVLINGAAGSLGSAAVQLAKYMGAHVTGTCSATNHPWVKALGADRVIDYQQQNLYQLEQRFDLIYDTVGKLQFAPSRALLSEQGMFMSPVGSLSLFVAVLTSAIFGNKKARFSATGILPVAYLRALLQQLVPLLQKGILNTVIDRRYALAEVVAAHAYADQQHKKGNLVVCQS